MNPHPTWGLLAEKDARGDLEFVGALQPAWGPCQLPHSWLDALKEDTYRRNCVNKTQVGSN